METQSLPWCHQRWIIDLHWRHGRALGKAKHLRETLPKRFGRIGQVGHQQLQTAGQLHVARRWDRSLRKVV